MINVRRDLELEGKSKAHGNTLRDILKVTRHQGKLIWELLKNWKKNNLRLLGVREH